MAKTFTGTVTSDVADKTITVTVTSRETHPIYGKQYTVTRKYAAHDEKNEAKKRRSRYDRRDPPCFKEQELRPRAYS